MSYSLKVQPADHFINWQQDPAANYLARLVFHERTREFRIEVDLIAEMSVLNPFDFFLAPYAEEFPFGYNLNEQRELAPYLVKSPASLPLASYLAGISRERCRTIDFVVGINQRLAADIRYLIRLEPGVQLPEETLAKRSGSCRDSAALLVQLLRHLGLAARFVSGYLIQLVPDVKALDGPGPSEDFTDLHAWCEVYLPGAGWLGLDPTSGLLAGEVDECETTFEHRMSVTRVPSVATWWCGERLAQDYVLENLERLIIKPTYPNQNFPSVFGRDLDADARAELARRIRVRPHAYVAQEHLAFSQAPVWRSAGAEGFAARALGIRVYAIATEPGYRVMPGGLARIAGDTADRVSMQRGGGSKDVWVLAPDRKSIDEVSVTGATPRAAARHARRAPECVAMAAGAGDVWEVCRPVVIR